MSQTVQELASRFESSAVRYESTQSGLVKVVVDSAVAQGELFLHGAHVTKFKPQGQSDVLWMSQRSLFEAGKPIRGGVPICFPWFGPHPTDSDAPSHGMARTAAWQLTNVDDACKSGGVTLELENMIGVFQLKYRVTVAATLELSLNVRLADQNTPATSFEAALHTYLAVGDVKNVGIEGLEQSSFIDKVDDAKIKPASGEPIQFAGECDRVYLETLGACTLRDPVMNRRIDIAKSGSRNTVVWNPWIAKSARMPDFGDSEWPSMVCVETANVGDGAVILAPDHSHEMTATVGVRSLD